MNETPILWTEKTWNPASGCKPVSAGCAHCYARSLAEQRRGTPAFPAGFDLTVREHKLREPGRVKRPSLIFTSSMTDVFYDGISDDYRGRIFDAIESCPQHRFQVLTKRIETARDWAANRPLPPNVWLGTTIEHEATAWRADVLVGIRAAIRFISAEPLLGRVIPKLDGIHWVIAGGESGLHLRDDECRERRGLTFGSSEKWRPRPDRVQWVVDLRDACVASGTAFFFKQWGGVRPSSGGRLLEGRTWDEMPTLSGAMPEGYEHSQRQAALHD